MFISKLNKFFDYYDPYGQLRVNALQTLMVMISLFLINFIYAPPYFENLIAIVMVGLLGGAKVVSFNQRKLIVIVFCFATVIYSIILNLVANYNLLSVLAVGVGMGFMYLLSRKNQDLTAIAVAVNLLAIVVVKIPNASNYYVYMRFILFIAGYMMICLVIMSLLPKVYYVRVWVRAYYLTLQEFENMLRDLANGSVIANNHQIKHLAVLNTFTRNINCKSSQITLRRMNILMMRLYTFLIATKYKALVTTSEELGAIADCLRELQQSIVEDQPNIQFTALSWQIKLPQRMILTQLGAMWNKLCLNS